MGYGSSTGSLAAASNAYQPADVNAPAQIGQRMDELTGSTERLHEMLSRLEQRLEGVLRPSSPDVAKGNPTPEPVQSPLTRGIREQAGRVTLAVQRIEDLLSRLEV